MSSELEALTVHLAKENPHWGYDKIQGELLKLGYNLSASSVRNILKRHRVTPASERSSGSWRSFHGHYKDQILACDFFTVEIIWLKTIYVLFFIELRNRRVHLAGCTTNPDTTWVTQLARQLVWNLKMMLKIWLFSSTTTIKNSPHLSISCFLQKRSRSFTPLIKPPGRMLSLNGGCARFAKSVWTIS